MALSFPLRSFAGMPVAGTLKTALTSTDGAGVTIESSTPLTGWTNVTGSAFPATASMCLTFGYGTASEEKILCTFNESTNVFTIQNRHYEGTTSYAWAAGSLFILTWTATEAAELNAVTQTMKTILTNSGTTTTPQPITIGTGVGAVGSGTKPSAIDHAHKITPSELNGFLGGASANATLGSNLLVPLANLVSGALPTTVTSSGLWTANSTTSTGPSVTTATGFTKYIVIAWAKIANTNATTDTNLTVQVLYSGTNYNPIIQTVRAGSTNGSATTFWYQTGLNAASTYTFQNNTATSGGTPANWTSYIIVIGLN